MRLQVNRDKLNKLLVKKGWSRVQLAKMMKLNYSYVYRVLKGERNAGSKFFSGLLLICRKENLRFDDFVYILKREKKEQHRPGSK